MRIEDFRHLLKSVRRSGDGWTAKCPAHDDRHASLSVRQGRGGRILVKCHAGCSTESVLSALGLRVRDLMPDSGEKRSQHNRPRARTYGTPRGGTATPHQSQGCTLPEYAEAKRLPLSFLRGIGLAELTYQGASAIRIPYFGRAGQELAVRFRTALSGPNRFRWKSGNRLTLYGLNRLANSPRYVVLVEGESDAHTLWHTGFPALGLPGASSWSEERDAPELDSIPVVYVVIEPDRGGETVAKWLSTSRIRSRVRLLDLDGFKDSSALYLDNPKLFAQRFRKALRAAVPWRERDALEAEARRKEAWSSCQRLAESRDILSVFGTDLAKTGVVGEERTAKILFLALISRFLRRPVSCAVKGPSSGGKNFVTEHVLQFFEETAYVTRSAGSERSLAYGEESLKHRVLVLFEAAGLGGDLAQYLIRSLLSEGFIHYETVEKTAKGMQPRVIRREGPTGLIVTTTAVRLHPENETRLLSLSVSDTPEQTRSVLRGLARPCRKESVDLGRWHALDRWIAAGQHEVEIPFAPALAECIPPAAVRLRRDFGALLNLIAAHALLHQATRKVDERGRVVATLEDYEAVRGLVADLFAEGLERAVSSTIRETVRVVADLAREGLEASVTAVAARLGLDKGPTSRRVREALDRGFLVNLQERRGRPFRLQVGEPLPEDSPLLPTASQLRRCGVASDSGGD